MHTALPFADVDDIRDIRGPCYIKRLPQELLDAIVKHICEDKQSLANCTLVLPQWLHRARYYLFDSVYIGREHRIRGFFDFLQAAPPHITKSIYRLTLDFGRQEDHGIDLSAFARAVGQIPSLGELWLRHSSGLIFPQSFSIAELRMTAPEVLVLEKGSICASKIATLIALFPNLMELYVESKCDIPSASVEDLDQDTLQALSRTEKLTKLAFGGGYQHAAVLDVVCLTSAAQFPAITEVELNFLYYALLPAAKRVFQECGAHLQKLAIDLVEFYHAGRKIRFPSTLFLDCSPCLLDLRMCPK